MNLTTVRSLSPRARDAITTLLEPAMEAAAQRILDHEAELQGEQDRNMSFLCGRVGTRAGSITRVSLQTFLDDIRFKIINVRSGRTHATARYVTKEIKIRSFFLEDLVSDSWTFPHPQARMVDLLLHEIAHLMTYWFFGTTGHNNDWRMLGRVLGFVGVGGTSNERRNGKMERIYRSRGWTLDTRPMTDFPHAHPTQPTPIFHFPQVDALPFVAAPILKKVAAKVTREPFAALTNVAQLTRHHLLLGTDDETILDLILQLFPTYGDGTRATARKLAVQYYRSQLRRQGQLPRKGA